ncbi:MAG: helix-turn-helix transcriptional regulator [Chloroflexi bacterium]|nr:helix-turn-helix transcriptional regulator [Chloroflexota bacterium]
MQENGKQSLGDILRQQRVALRLTLHQVAAAAGVSPSHLGRIEKGERFPSAHVLRKVASPLGFEEDELFTLAGYLSPESSGVAEKATAYRGTGRLDPYVSRILSQEPVEVQHAVIGILMMLKSVAKGLPKEDKGPPGQEPH